MQATARAEELLVLDGPGPEMSHAHGLTWAILGWESLRAGQSVQPHQFSSTFCLPTMGLGRENMLPPLSIFQFLSDVILKKKNVFLKKNVLE